VRPTEPFFTVGSVSLSPSGIAGSQLLHKQNQAATEGNGTH
jgi:hypothetical protein